MLKRLSKGICPRRHISRETLIHQGMCVQGDFCPRSQLSKETFVQGVSFKNVWLFKLFLGARAPLQLVYVKKKECKKFENINYLLYLANCLRSKCKCTSMPVCKYTTCSVSTSVPPLTIMLVLLSPPT